MALQFCTVFQRFKKNFLFFFFFASKCAWTFKMCQCCHVSNPSSVCLYRAVYPEMKIQPREQVPKMGIPLYAQRGRWSKRLELICDIMPVYVLSQLLNNAFCALHILPCREEKAQPPNCVSWINTPFADAYDYQCDSVLSQLCFV